MIFFRSFSECDGNAGDDKSADGKNRRKQRIEHQKRGDRADALHYHSGKSGQNAYAHVGNFRDVGRETVQ